MSGLLRRLHGVVVWGYDTIPSCYSSVSLARMRRYMQLAYIFHQYAKSLLSTDGHIADCTVRHPGVERPFSSIIIHILSEGVRRLLLENEVIYIIKMIN